jgi:Carboxypeptidase regulatory-like domain
MGGFIGGFMRRLPVFSTLRAAFSSSNFLLTATVVLVLAVFLNAPLAEAQISGTLSGTVTDQTGAVVPKAKVMLVNQATQDTRETISNGSGYFAFTGLLPATYTVKIEAAGFKSWQHAEITLNPGDVRTISDIALHVGQTTEVVAVEAVAGEVAPVDSGERSSVISAKDIDRLSIQGRDVSELLKILPGVTNTGQNLSAGSGTFANFLNVGSMGSPVGNGLDTNGVPSRGGTTLLLDGANIIDPGCNCTSVAMVNADMTQEVKVSSTNFGADNPKGPVVISNISKSGTTAYHGTGFFYARNYVLNAKDWQTAHNKSPLSQDHYYYPGGNFGGPIPYTKNKLLFWFGYEHFLQNTGNAGVLQSSLPTASMLAGDFTPTNQDNQVNCPDGFSSTATNWCNNLAGTILPDGTVVPDNGAAGYQIPSQFLDPGSKALAKVFPTTGVLTTADAIAANGGYNYRGTFPGIHNGYVVRSRVDYNFSDNTKFFVSFQKGNDSSLHNGTGAHMWWTPGNAIPFPGGGLQSANFSKTLTGHFLHVFSPTLTSEFIAAWGWGNSPITASTGSVSRSGLQYPTTYTSIFAGNRNIKMIPSFGCGYCGPNQLPDFSQYDIFETGGEFFVRTENPSFADNVTKVYRTHTLKFGAFYERVGKFQGNTGYPNGSINQWGGQHPDMFTGDPLGSQNNRVANFVMGIANQYEEESSLPSNNIGAKTIAGYINDNWKMTKRLTLELGARWEHIGHWYDRSGNGIAVFLPNLVNSDFVSGGLYPGLRWHANDPGVPMSGAPDHFAHFSPRFGVAWDIFGTGKTVVRGGWGMYRWNDQYNDFTGALSPGLGIRSYFTPGNETVLLSQVSSITVPAAQWSPNPVTALSANDYNVPLTYSWNLTISHQLPGRSLLELAYVGNDSEHILMGGGSSAGLGSSDFMNVNKTPRGALFGADPLTGVLAPNPEDVSHDLTGGALPNSYADYHPYGVYLGSGTLHGAQIYGTQSITVPTHVGYSNYHAFQASWIRQSGRLTYNLNYTWSKALGTDLAIDPYSLRGNYGVEGIDHPHVINASYAYNLPNFTHGSKVLGGITNGWTVSGTTNWQAGGNLQAINNANGPNFGLGIQYINQPANLPSGNALSQKTYYGSDATNGFTIQPALTCNPASGLHSLQRANLACFTAPDFQTQGVRNFPYLHGPIYLNSDLSVYKTFHVTERQAVEFRLAAFNWLNHPLEQFTGGNQLALPFLMDYNTHAISLNQTQLDNNTPNWGYLNYKNGYPGGRIMDLSVKYTF